MAPPTTVTHHHPMNNRSMLDKELGHSNFLDWNINLRIFLKQEKKEYVLESQDPKEPPFVPNATHDACLKHADDSLDVSYLMLAIMIPDLQWVLEHFNAFNTINISSK